MYKKIASWLLPVLVISLVVVGYWGYSEYKISNTLYNNSESQYQRAFYELSYYIDSVEDELGKSIAVSTPGQIRRSLANVWRLSYAAQSRVGQLPLGTMEFTETEDFIARVADFSYRAAIRDLDNDPVSDEEWETLKTLYQCSLKIQGQMNTLHNEVINKQLRWTDFELNYVNLDENIDNPIVKNFNSLEDEVTQFPEVSWGTGIDSINQIKQEKIKRVSNGEIFSEKMIKDKVVKFLDLEPDKQFKIIKNPDGGEYVTYSVYVTYSDENIIYLDITEVEGNILWLLHDRVVGKPAIDLQEAESKAVEYLKKLDVENVIATNIDDYENIAIISFASYENNTVIYPDTITVKIALDNGEIIGFSSIEYLLNHNKRDLGEIKLTIDEAKKKLNPKLQVEEQRLAIIEADDGIEVLTYEFIGTIDENTYKIFLNVESGLEEKVEKVDQIGIQRVFNNY
jgi:spore germination protein